MRQYSSNSVKPSRRPPLTPTSICGIWKKKNHLIQWDVLTDTMGHYDTEPIREENYVPCGTNKPITSSYCHPKWRFDVTQSHCHPSATLSHARLTFSHVRSHAVTLAVWFLRFYQAVHNSLLWLAVYCNALLHYYWLIPLLGKAQASWNSEKLARLLEELLTTYRWNSCQSCSDGV